MPFGHVGSQPVLVGGLGVLNGEEITDLAINGRTVEFNQSGTVLGGECCLLAVFISIGV